jgi:hypothetical protein
VHRSAVFVVGALCSLVIVSCNPLLDGGGGSDTSADTGSGADEVIVVEVNLAINELMASNPSQAVDPEDPDATPDWVELVNLGADDVPLEGFWMSDDLDEPNLHELGDLTIPAGGFLVLQADNDPGAGATHLGFKLGRESDSVGLFAPDGTPLDRVTFESVGDGQVVGRLPDGGTLTMLSVASPGASNNDALSVEER